MKQTEGSSLFTTRGLKAFYVSDMSLKLLHSKPTHNKPQLKRTETSAERNLPVLEKKKKKNMFTAMQTITTRLSICLPDERAVP